MLAAVLHPPRCEPLTLTAVIRVSLLLALLGGAADSRAIQEAEPQQTQIAASVNIVRLRVAVVHRSGGVLPPLTAEDFRVFDNGVEQSVRLLYSPEDTPVRVALVVDSSPSIRPWKLTMQRTAVTFLAKLGDRACPYVLPFAERVGPGRWGRYNANSWRAFLENPPPGAATSLHDALIIALDQLMDADAMAIEASQEREPSGSQSAGGDPATGAGDVVAVPAGGGVEPPAGEWLAGQKPVPDLRGDFFRAQLRRIVARIVVLSPPTHVGNCDLRYTPAGVSGVSGVAGVSGVSEGEPPADGDAVRLPPDEAIKAVLLLSDGADTSSVSTADDVVVAAQVANIPIFPVMIGAASQDRDLATLLEGIARDTGGSALRDVSIQELGSAYDEILAYLRSSYVLVYDANAAAVAEETPDGWHEIRVDLRRPLLRPIVRPGYYR